MGCGRNGSCDADQDKNQLQTDQSAGAAFISGMKTGKIRLEEKRIVPYGKSGIYCKKKQCRGAPDFPAPSLRTDQTEHRACGKEEKEKEFQPTDRGKRREISFQKKIAQQPELTADHKKEADDGDTSAGGLCVGNRCFHRKSPFVRKK